MTVASSEVLIGAALLVLAALAAFAVHRRRMRARVCRVEGWVRDYLTHQYGSLPAGLNVNCTDDTHWPVLVAFDDPATGSRRRLQFSCPGPSSTFSLLPGTEDARVPEG
jgi:hypothetical protein